MKSQKQSTGVMQNKGAGKTMSTDAKFKDAMGTPSGLEMKKKIPSDELHMGTNMVTKETSDKIRKSPNER